MNRLRILVLQHAPVEGLGLFERVFFDGADVHVLEAFGDPVAYRRSIDQEMAERTADAVVILGGPQSVVDHAEHEALEESLRLTRWALRTDLPLLGICLGAQILAWSLGAPVRPGRILGLRKEIGWFPLQLTERGRVDPLFHGFSDGTPVFQWHGDTFELPAGSWHLARSTRYEHQAFRYGRWVYGLQFHMEVVPLMVAEWVRAYADELAALDDVDPAAMVASAEQRVDDLASHARVAAEHFLALVRESAAEKRFRPWSGPRPADAAPSHE